MSEYDHTADGLTPSPCIESDAFDFLAASQIAPEQFQAELDEAFGYNELPTDDDWARLEQLYAEYQQRDMVLAGLLTDLQAQVDALTNAA